ncbi:MAG TPA: lytic transglycosylase domain-containing protein [Dongiaceae bacterium]|nr:lytic transglycosylase domain-containing protein [Dongiaceae bacterium]
MMQRSLRLPLRFSLLVLLTTALLTVPVTAALGGDLFDRTAARYELEPELLRAIAKVESNLYPWAININWESFRPESPYQAVRLIRKVRQNPWLLRVDYADRSDRLFFPTGLAAQQALAGLRQRATLLDIPAPHQWEIRKLDVRSVDIGLMQINWKFHGEHFESMEDLFDPATNLDYAARFLRQLLKTHGDLETAVAHYHSSTIQFQEIYLKNVRAVYEQQRLLARREE